MGLTLFNPATLEIIKRLPWQEFIRPAPITSMSFSPDGKWLACGIQNGMLLLEVPSLRQIQSFSGPRGVVSSIDFSPDGECLVGVSQGGASQLVNLRIMREVGDLGAAENDMLFSARFSPDGRTLAISGIESGIRLFHSQ